MRAIIAFAAIGLAACGTTVQTSSGADYVRRTDQGLAALSTSAEGLGGTDALRAAASVEPLLRFPAKIGIARIEDGALTPIPDAEMAAFAEALAQTGGAYGEFAPLNLLVTAMAVPEEQLAALSGGYAGPGNGLVRARRAVDAIRIGAARQHMDAVLVYEVFGTQDAARNALSVGDLTILGAFLLPGQEVDAVGHAEGILIDVRNAYPYLTASETVTRDGLSSTVRRRKRGEELKSEAQLQAVRDMADTLPAAFARLAVDLGNLPETEVASAE